MLWHETYMYLHYKRDLNAENKYIKYINQFKTEKAYCTNIKNSHNNNFNARFERRCI